MNTKARSFAFWSIFLLGCAGMDRECSQCGTEVHGANWLVVQLKTDGEISRCWRLSNLAVANEPHSDGIWWVDSGEQVHISGWYNYVQVSDWGIAARTLGVELNRCHGGKYLEPNSIKLETQEIQP